MGDRRSSKRVRTWVWLIVLAAVVVVLTLLAMKKAHPDVPDAGETPGYDPSTSSFNEPVEDTDGEESTGDDEEDKADGAFSVAPAARVLSASDASVAYRAATGACPGAGATIEATVDGGGSWTAVNLVDYVAASGVQDLSAGSDGAAQVLAFSPEDCASPVMAATYSYGEEWMALEGGEAWWFAPGTATLNGPGAKTVTAPCEVARLAVSGGDLTVLCADSSLAFSQDEGDSWKQSESISGAQDVSVHGRTIYLAQTGASSCEGTAIQTYGPDLEVKATQCVEGVASPGETTISVSDGGAMWLWAGEDLVKSVDGGETWE